jgi:hypothetical protein
VSATRVSTADHPKTGVREERSSRKVGKSTIRTSTDYVFSAVWRDPRTGQDRTFSTRSVSRSRYAIGSSVTDHVDPNDYSRYVFPQ